MCLTNGFERQHTEVGTLIDGDIVYTRQMRCAVDSSCMRIIGEAPNPS